MKKIISAGMIFFQAASFAAETYAYKILDESFIDKKETIHEINPSTPVKSQDGIGLCYGFSSTSLLETFRCRELGLDCSAPDNFLSAFDVTSYYKNSGLEEGGQAFGILSNIEKSNRKIAREECARFSTLVHKVTKNGKMETLNEKKGWLYLTQVWNNYKSPDNQTDCVSCLADSIKSRLGNIKTPADQIENALKTATTLEEFLYKTVLPVECREESKMADIPAFHSHSYPTLKDEFDENKLRSKMISLLESGTPIEMGICAERSYTENCQSRQGHSIALYGIKEACSKKSGECKKLVKVKNSYGLGWQKRFNNGWVDMETLLKSSISFATFDNISWIDKSK